MWRLAYSDESISQMLPLYHSLTTAAVGDLSLSLFIKVLWFSFTGYIDRRHTHTQLAAPR